jgi:SHS family lactate transporter-like MFS transporter
MATFEEKPTGDHFENFELESKMTMSQYVRTRISTLAPPMTKVENPFKLLGLLNRQQWFFFLVLYPFS